MTDYTSETIAKLLNENPGRGSRPAVAVVVLMDGDHAWNPASTKSERQLLGPEQGVRKVTYKEYADGGIDTHVEEGTLWTVSMMTDDVPEAKVLDYYDENERVSDVPNTVIADFKLFTYETLSIVPNSLYSEQDDDHSLYVNGEVIAATADAAEERAITIARRIVGENFDYHCCGDTDIAS